MDANRNTARIHTQCGCKQKYRQANLLVKAGLQKDYRLANIQQLGCESARQKVAVWSEMEGETGALTEEQEKEWHRARALTLGSQVKHGQVWSPQ